MDEWKDRSYSDQKIKSKSNRCFYCNAWMSPYDRVETEAPTVDHIKPKSSGGIRSKKNKAYCCFKCNQLKGDMSPEQFFEFLKSYAKALQFNFNKEKSYIHKVKGSLKRLFDQKRKTDGKSIRPRGKSSVNDSRRQSRDSK